ncbi:MAG: molybdopterin-dependent oxidoreductase [Desulfomonilaceae bacterium]|nr:molybdopterin-dependent oxidoreductase [Desulfomonilaceae bacterium]
MRTKRENEVTSRRNFLAGGAMLGAGLLVSRGHAEAAGQESGRNAVLNSARPDAEYEQARPENMIHTVCLQCNTGCGIRCKQQDGVITKVDGNPYNPWTLFPHLDYDTPLVDASAVDGSICPKGQAGLQTAYDPYRIRKVLKRAGTRGDNKWTSIPFDQAVKEISDGGKLFGHVPGEENREVEGLKSIAVLKDPKVSKAMAEDVKRIWKEKDKDGKQQLVEEFKKKYSEHLDTLIDPNHPDRGPKNNQIVCAWGRMKGGRKEHYKRFSDALGTVNAHGHTTVCQGSLYFTCKAISEQYEEGRFSGGKKFYWQADTENCRFILFVGANLFEANYGPPNRSVRLTGNLVSGRTKIAVVDPRLSKLASKAWKWLPLKPGTDAALALAITRWMLDNKRYDEKFLRCANKAAAKQAGESSWCNATWLVEIKDGKPGKFIRAADHGLAEAEGRKTAEGKEYTEKFLVAMVNGKPAVFDPNDDKNPVIGDLLVDAELDDGTKVKSGLQIVYESAKEHSIEEWAEIAGLDERAVVETARELTSYGKRAAVDCHRGPAQHTNGFYNVLAWMTVNMLLGNIDAKGGMIAGSSYDAVGKKNKLHEIEKQPGIIKSFGISSIRHGVAYEDTTLFEGYPAKRNWYPISSDVYEEIVPSIGDGYPYPVKALFLYKGAPTYSLPAGHTNIEVLCDTKKLPLFVANDILIGTASMYADYIFPDLSHLERWEFQGSHPNIPNKVQPVRQPAMAPIPEEVTVFGQPVPICFESMMMGIAEYMKLPGYGKDGFGKGLDFTHPDDLYIRGVANLAFGEKPDGSEQVPDADEREMQIFRDARTHLPKSVYDEKRWREIAGDEMWPKVVYVLNRGGRFENHAKAYKGDRTAHPWGKLLNLYQELTASTVHSGTGESNPGHAVFLPIRDYHGNEPTELRKGFELHLITNRTIVHCKSRTIADAWLSPLMPENGLMMNPVDIKRLGLRDGQKVKVVSATNTAGEWDLGAGNKKPMVGKIIATQTMRPGIISFVLGFGHWATGAADVMVDGATIKGEARRATGIHANAAMWIDPALKNTCMLDPVGGSVSFYDTYVRLEPVV